MTPQAAQRKFNFAVTALRKRKKFLRVFAVLGAIQMTEAYELCLSVLTLKCVAHASGAAHVLFAKLTLKLRIKQLYPAAGFWMTTDP